MGKGPEAFRTISEAADEVGVAQHVLRFWEDKFSFIRPMKRTGGRRLYRPHEIEVLVGVRALLHDEGLSIKAVQQLHRTGGLTAIVAAARRSIGPDGRRRLSDLDRRRLSAALQDLSLIKGELDALLAFRAPA